MYIVYMIYADNAATTKLDIEAFEAMKPFLLEEYGNASQPYFFSKKAKMALKDARKQIARCINAEPEEIFFTSGGTESDNWVIKNFGLSTDIRRIITSEIEHHAVLNACKHMEEMGVSLVLLPVTNTGLVKSETLAKCFELGDASVASCETTLVSIMLANNEIGTIQNIKELSEIAHRNGAYFHTDAVQAVGHIPIDVKELGVDFLSASAHKFNGPKGIGFLYARNGSVLQPLNDGGAQERGMRAGTENVASIVGMAVALKNNVIHIEDNASRLSGFEAKLEKQLLDHGISFIRNGDGNHIPGSMSLSFADQEGEMLLHRLDLMKICVSTGSACDSVNTQISHVLKAIHLDERIAKGTIRISLGKNNSEEEITSIADAIAKIINS